LPDAALRQICVASRLPARPALRATVSISAAGTPETFSARASVYVSA